MFYAEKYMAEWSTDYVAGVVHCHFARLPAGSRHSHGSYYHLYSYSHTFTPMLCSEFKDEIKLIMEEFNNRLAKLIVLPFQLNGISKHCNALKTM